MVLHSQSDSVNHFELEDVPPVEACESRSELSLNNIEQTIRSSVARETLKEWLTPQPWIVYWDLAIAWLFILIAFGGIAYWHNWLVSVIAFCTIGFSQYGLFILGHDALHHSLHPNRKVNDLLARWLIYGPMFMGLDDGRRNHLNHHRWFGTSDDPDRYLHSLANKNSRWKLFLFCTGLATFGKTVIKVSPFGKIKHRPGAAESSAPISSKSATKSQALSEYFMQRIPVFVMQALIIALLISIGLPWWSYFVFWIAPIYFCVFLPDEVRAFCDHSVPLLPDTAADPYRLVSFAPAWWEAIIFSPNSMNYHAEHHLFPAIPYYHLHKAHQALRYNPHITVKRSYIHYLLQLFAKLPVTPVGGSCS
jgi:fatty acid desaturase